MVITTTQDPKTVQNAKNLIINEVMLFVNEEVPSQEPMRDSFLKKVKSITEDIMSSSLANNKIFISRDGNILFGKQAYLEFSEQLIGKLHEQGAQILKNDNDSINTENLIDRLAKHLDAHDKIEILGVRETINPSRVDPPHETPLPPAPAPLPRTCRITPQECTI